MIRHCFLPALVTIIGLFFFGSCQRDSVPAESPRFRLSQIKMKSPFSIEDSVLLKYGYTGKLTSYTTTYAGGHYSIGNLRYNQKEQLTRAEENLVMATGIVAHSSYSTHSYDQVGNDTTIAFYSTPYSSGTYSLRRVDKLEYNDRAQPVKTTTITYTEGGKLLSTSIAERIYQAGNVVSVKVTEPAIPRITTITFLFDDKLNPFDGMVGFPASFGGPTYNHNNITARRGGLEEDVIHEITYNDDGLLISQIMNANLTSNRQIKYSYTYETY